MNPCTCHPGNDCASAASCAAARRVEFGDDMTTTQAGALPELPKPHIGLPWRHNAPDGSVHSSAYTADQMRAYALAALQSQPAAAGVSDAEWWHDVLGLAGPDLLNLAKHWSDNEVHVYQFVNEAEKIVKAAAQRAILALRPQSESEQEKELRRSLAEAQATISERNAEIIELQKRIRRSPQAVPMTDERLAEVLTTAYGSPEWTMDDVRAARVVEAAVLGITAPAGGEKQA